MQRKLTLRTMAAVFDEWIEAVCAARKAQKMLRKVTSSEPPEPATCPTHTHSLFGVHLIYPLVGQ